MVTTVGETLVWFPFGKPKGNAECSEVICSVSV